MSLRAVLFTVSTVGWVFAALGVVYRDGLARDVGLLVAVAGVALALILGDDVDLRPKRAPKSRPRSAPQARSQAPTPAAPKAPATTVEPPAEPAPAAAEPARDTGGAMWGQATATWEAPDAPKGAALEQPVAVQPTPSGNGAPREEFDVAPGKPAGDPHGTTRGMCGSCRTPITVSNRRPLRVTCPVCNHSKLLT